MESNSLESLEDRPDYGSPDEVPMTAPNQSTPLPAGNPLSSGRSVLIVDDEPVIRAIARASLTAAGFVVAEAGDLNAALAALHRSTHPFDLVLLDLSLGDTKGVDLIPIIRQKSPATRILLFSGVLAEDAEGVDADGFLAKPFTKTTLLMAVWQALVCWEQTQKS